MMIRVLMAFLLLALVQAHAGGADYAGGEDYTGEEDKDLLTPPPPTARGTARVGGADKSADRWLDDIEGRALRIAELEHLQRVLQLQLSVATLRNSCRKALCDGVTLPSQLSPPPTVLGIRGREALMLATSERAPGWYLIGSNVSGYTIVAVEIDGVVLEGPNGVAHVAAVETEGGLNASQ